MSARGTSFILISSRLLLFGFAETAGRCFLKKFPFFGGGGTLPPLRNFYLPRATLAIPGPLELDNKIHPHLLKETDFAMLS